MPGDHRERAVAGLIGDLKRVWYLAGDPSYEDVEEMSGQITQPVGDIRVTHLARSTVQAVIGGRRRRRPRWRWVASLVIVLRALAAREGLNPEAIGTVAQWKAKYEQMLWLLGEPRHGMDVEEADDAESERLAISLAAGNDPLTSLGGLLTAGTAAARVDAHPGRDRLLALATRVHAPAWWHPFADVVADWFLPYLVLEQAATRIRAYETRYIPGLLQDEEYAEAVIRLVHNTASAAEIKRRVEVRMLRKNVLNRPQPAQLWCLVDQAALHRQYGTRKILRRQIQRLIDLSDKPNIAIQIMPFERGCLDPWDRPIAHLRFIENKTRDLIYLEDPTGGQYPPELAAITYFGQILDRLGIQAESPKASRDILSNILRQI